MQEPPYPQPYPLYQQQPPPQWTPQPPRKRSRRILWIVLAVLAILMLGCIGAAALATRGASTSVGTVIPTTSTLVPVKTTHVPTAVRTHYKQHDAVQVTGLWDVEIVSVKTSKGSEFTKPQQAGDVFLVFVVKVKNIASQEQTISSALQFVLADANGQKYDETFADAGATLDGKVEASGGLLQGSLAFEVPMSAKAFTLAFSPALSEQGQVIWDIRV